MTTPNASQLAEIQLLEDGTGLTGYQRSVAFSELLLMEGCAQWTGEQFVRRIMDSTLVTLASIGVYPSVMPLVMWHLRSKMSHQAWCTALHWVWPGQLSPHRALPNLRWVQMFNRAGFTYDGQPAERPKTSVTLFRGATPEGAAGMSWTDNKMVANNFAQRRWNTGKVWSAEIPAWRLLAVYPFSSSRSPYFDGMGSEYVINPFNRGALVANLEREAGDLQSWPRDGIEN